MYTVPFTLVHTGQKTN